jgi:hypothetical protein
MVELGAVDFAVTRREIRDTAAQLTDEMIMLGQHSVVARSTIGQLHDAQLSQCNELLQVAVNGAEADLG